MRSVHDPKPKRSKGKVRTNHRQEAKPTDFYLAISVRKKPIAIVVDAKMRLSRFSDMRALDAIMHLSRLISLSTVLPSTCKAGSLPSPTPTQPVCGPNPPSPFHLPR